MGLFKKMLAKFHKRNHNDLIVLVDGGFCSTISQYAIGRFFEKKFGVNVKYDLTWFDFNGMDCDGKCKRNFDLLKVFPNLKFDIADPKDVALYKKYFNFYNERAFIYNDNFFGKTTPLYLGGYYVHWKYFDFVKEELLKEIDFSYLESTLSEENKNFLEEINLKENSVAVHVRRGDFVNLGHCFLTPEYFISAMEHIAKTIAPKKPHFYFFSNGMDWVKENIVNKLSDDISYSFVEGNDNDAGYNDLYFISKCKHQITSNSSFSFLGSFLNQNKQKIVIIPDKWYAVPNEYNENSEMCHRIPGWIVWPSEGAVVKC